MPRKNTKNTQPKYVSFDQMLSQSFWELFHSNSKSAIWNKEQLNLSSYINWNEVSSLVDWGQLDLIEKKHLKLVDTQQLVNFVQYVGAFSAVFLLLGSFSLRVALDQYIYSRNLAFEHAQTYAFASVPTKEANQMEFTEAVLGVSTSAVYISNSEVFPTEVSTSEDTYDYRDSVWNEETSVMFVEDETMLVEPAVSAEEISMLGMEVPNTMEVVNAMEVENIAEVANAVEATSADVQGENQDSTRTMTRSNLCSFSNGNAMYASGSTVTQNQVSNEICIKAPNSISNITASLLGLGGEDNLRLNGSGCVKLGSKVEADSSKLNVEMYDENNLKVGNCELVFASL
ncbi:MAG: hypothetical protein QG628_1088 [Patescibacteria group bacterium]|nr:hypothetical protein [Patescibacteria group bacterium]